jgi:hypothetical protein
MKVRARLGYVVVLEAQVPDTVRAFVANPQVLLDQAVALAKPAFATTLQSLLLKLRAIGVTVRAEAAELTLQAEPPP